MRVARLVVPDEKSFCSSSSTPRPARAQSRAMATPLMPPPITTISNCSSASDGRRTALEITSQLDASEPKEASLCSSFPIPKVSYRLVHMGDTGERFERAVAIMARLRAPGGCPWDREQTFDSIKPYTLEEAYEVLEAIDNRDWDELSGELGDLLLQVLFYSEMSKEQGTFTIDDVLDRLSKKLVDRHPHVFGETKADTASEVVKNWEAIKAEEKKKRLAAGGGKSADQKQEPESVLGGVSSAMPSLLEA